MSPLSPSSPRAMEAFEMLVGRLSNIEAELRAQRVATELRADMAPRGMINGVLDPETASPFVLFKGYSGLAQGVVFVTGGGGSSLYYTHDYERHRQTLAAAWGPELADRAIAAEAAATAAGDSNPLSKDVGAAEDVAIAEDVARRHEHMFTAMQEAILRAAFPGVVERLTPYGLWLRLEKPTGVRDLLRLLRAMGALVGSERRPEECVRDGWRHLKFYGVNYGPEATAFLMSYSSGFYLPGEPEQLRRIRAEWWRLPKCERERVRREVGYAGSLVAELLSGDDIEALEEA